jgi:non-specific serine/threonine protein kinase/serine/threonine-protein kinase
MNGLAGNYQRERRYAEAEKLERQALETERRVLGPDRPEALESMNNLGETLQSEGHYAEAEKLQRETLAVVSRVFGPTHPNTLSVMTDLAETLQKEGHYGEAEKLQREILDHVRTIFGTDSPQTLDALQALAICMSVQKHYDEAKPLFAEAVHVATRIKSQDGLAAVWYSSACGAAVSGHPEDAVQDLRRAIDAGYVDAGRMANEDQLKSLGGTEQFKTLLAETRKRAASTTKKTN